MSTRGYSLVYNGSVFLAWTVTSFLCHSCAKAFLLLMAEGTGVSDNDVLVHAVHAGVLTLVQSALCYVSVDIITRENSWMDSTRTWHVLATWATNLSLTFMAASSTLAVKLMEPITSAVTQMCIYRTPVSPVTALSLPIIVGGAIAFAGNPFTDVTLSLGFGFAFISNILLAFRNLAIKGATSGDNNAIKFKVKLSHLFSTTPVLLGTSFLFLYLQRIHYLHPNTIFAAATCFISGVFHVAYSYVSTGLVLSQMSVVSHAISNIIKRVLVVLLLYVVGKRVATAFNFLGLVVCTLGLLVYTWDKQIAGTKKNPHAGEQLSKSFKLPRRYVVFAVFCLTGAWIGRQVLLTPSFIGPSGVSVVRRWLGMRKSVMFQDDESVFTYSSFSQHTFGPASLHRPEDWQLEPNLQGYPSNISAGIQTFLNSRLIKNSEESNHLCQHLRTPLEVIREAQRIHYNMFGDAIGKFKYCILLDTADFVNKGDSAITVGEMIFITRLGLKLIYYCSTFFCRKDGFKTAAAIASTYSTDELVILLHGGGNINIYALHDQIRATIFEVFRGYQLFIFPQSIFLKNASEERFQRCINLYCCNENLTFVQRDYQSHDIAKKYFNGSTRHLVAPDMAFHIGPVKRFMQPVFDILWIQRSDTETPGYDKVPSHPPHLRLHVSDWFKFAAPKAGTSWEKSNYETIMGLFFTQRGRIVVTDRIHGHILATLLGLPNVLLDNKVKKLSSFYNSWTKSIENTRLAFSPEQAMEMALELLEIYGDHDLPPRVPWLNISESDQPIDYSLPDFSFI